MLRLAFKTVILILAVFAVFFVFSKFDNKNLDDESILRVTVAKDIKNLDYIFVGPSYVYNGIIPAQFDSLGLNTFNLGQATVGPCFSELLINDYIKASGSKPKNILLSMSYTTFSDVASDAWDKMPLHRYLNFPLSNEQVAGRYANINTYVKLLRNSFKKGLGNLAGRNAAAWNESTRERIRQQKGYAKNLDVYTPSQYLQERQLFLPYLKGAYSYEKEKLFFDIIDHCEKQNIHVVVIEPPTFRLKDFFTDKFKIEYEKMKEKISARGIELINPGPGMDSTCFKNLDHLNYKGARIYTGYLVSKLENS
jgi:hypothetical protein